MSLIPKQEDYKTGGDSCQTQSHPEFLEVGSRFSDWGRGKKQWLAFLLFWSSGLTWILVSSNISLWTFIKSCFKFTFLYIIYMVTNLHNSFLPGDCLFTLLNLQSHKIRIHSLLHNFNNNYTLCPQSQHSVIAYHNSNLGEYVFKYSFLYLQFQEILCPLLAGTSCGASMYNQAYAHTHACK